MGWILAGIGVGLVSGVEVTALPMRIAAVASVVAGLYAFTMPIVTPPAKAKRAKAPKLIDLLGIGLLKRMDDSPVGESDNLSKISLF